MTLSTQPIKGARDFYPEDERLQKYIFTKWREVCERFGYEEYDSPILEPIELFLSKGNEEIINEQTYSFEDRGERKLIVRTEMTPSVSRMVAARRQELAYPLRWYSIPQCWRYERTQRGRGREFYQLNVDIFGVDDSKADMEIIQVADAVMQSFGAKRASYEIKVNSRKLVDEFLLNILKLDETQTNTLRKLIDKRAKIESTEFNALVESVFSPSQRDNGTSQQLLQFLDTDKIESLPDSLQQLSSTKELTELISQLNKANITNIQFDPSLMRGFDYYTDITFEVFDTNPENNRSMFGGGRYDGLIAMFGVEPVPTVGFGMGDIPLQNFLEVNNLVPELRVETDLYVIMLGDVFEPAVRVVKELREMGINAAVDYTGRKLDRQIKSADKKGINYILFIGDKELEDQQFTLKNLKTGVEEKHSLQRIVSAVKDHRKK